MNKGNLSVSFARDSVDAEFTDGSNIPRMVPDRNIYSVFIAMMISSWAQA